MVLTLNIIQGKFPLAGMSTINKEKKFYIKGIHHSLNTDQLVVNLLPSEMQLGDD